ncbi:MAG TPA: YggS family pyridoxal phosphate-dependent enzyme [Gemmatimonadales bacterium]|nr:YggS family pyridoxal phosphate-dependent enzyme [Gemmatimonadales bacterium]
MDFPGLPARLAIVRETVAKSQAARGWQHSVRIVGVTKTHGPEAVTAALAAGLQDIGENRVQEALQKQDVLPGVAVEWHLIGTLQRNKARHVAGRFAFIHSLDREDLATELDRRAAAVGGRQSVLVQVNCSAEPQKGGVPPGELPALLDEIARLEHLDVRGLMTMSALTEDRAEQRRAFHLLWELREAGERSGHRLPELSMGMSGDYPIAVEEGATMIRLGTVLFGERGS